ncbi:MAG TPA: amylo-alpha-1,6-glucosidase [Tepidisphaeraceae bacterium]|jgi:predicted glycogen debranching enzyme|nr:amylo-alpha-1,6-glucosidase [Tepidisphaeraceae bacterium]
MPLFSLDTLGHLHPFLNYEWLLTNGIGSFSSSTLVGCNTRRYHGLLTAATLPPLGRINTLNRVGELLYLDGNRSFLELSINQFRNSMHPRGDKYLRRFQLDGAARFDYDVEGVKVAKEIQLLWQRNTVGIRYRVECEPNRQVQLDLIPFISLRDFHSLRHAGPPLEVHCDTWEMLVRDGQHALKLRADAGQFTARADWWYGHAYPIESERGLDDSEDLFVPGILSFSTRGPFTITLWAGTDLTEIPNWDAELARRPNHIARCVIPVAVEAAIAKPAEISASPAIQKLSRAAADFVVARRRPDGKDGTTIIAGYPWFSDWGRDTMIALPGLLLTPSRFTEAAQVLTLFAEYVSEGMIPNRFDDYNNEPSYNTVDASLWFIHACFEYLRLSHDAATFNKHLLDACRAIIKGYRGGTRFNIHMDADGLIYAGDEHTQLTWMDAKCDGIAFTPRHGKAVEINALWYNALVLLNETELAARVRQSFLKTFWLNPFRGLADFVNEKRKDTQIRPNQIFAASLPNSPLDHDQQRAVVEVVRRELLTPFGLRTLPKTDPNYQGRYFGPPMKRDNAYHNGTIWPWLIGAFLEGHLKVNDHSPDSQRQGRVWLQPLIDSMNQGCVGQIAEIYEADEPHRPVGCPAQAWSVAEVLRLAVILRM